MAIAINRKDYGSSEFNGFPPNEVFSISSTTALASGSSYTIEADFKDHKTVFGFTNTLGATASVTIKAGDTYAGVNDLDLTIPTGTSYIWLDSSKYVDKEKGEITVTTTASQSLAMFGFEMR